MANENKQQAVRQFLISMYPQCISLIDAQKRYDNSEAEFRKMGIFEHVNYFRPTRVPSKDGGGIAGCRQSHLAVLKRGLEVTPPLPYFIIFEDDLQWNDSAVDTLYSLMVYLRDVNPKFSFDMIKLFGLGIIPLSKDNSTTSLLRRVQSTSTVGYIISRRFAQRVIDAKLDNYHCHVDWQYIRMSTMTYMLQPWPIRTNDALESSVVWGNTIGSIMMQDLTQKVITPPVLEKIFEKYRSTQQLVGMYKPSTTIHMLDANQPYAEETRNFLHDHGVPLNAYDDLYTLLDE